MQNDVDDFARVRALVIGDCMLDRYLQGPVTRISPEAPVPIVAIGDRRASPGGAANVAAGLSSLGAVVTLAGVIGKDSDGTEMLEQCHKLGVNTELVFQSTKVDTVCKTRVLAEHNQQLLRLDEDGSKADRETESHRLFASLPDQICGFDIVVLADYEKGTLSEPIIDRLLYAAYHAGVPTVVDPKKSDLAVYSRATILTPNRSELERSSGRAIVTLDELRMEADNWRIRSGAKFLLVTCGADGMILTDGHQTLLFPAVVRQVADVTGAGDTVVSILAACLGSGWRVADACRLASLGAGLAVSEPGVHVVGAPKLKRTWKRQSPKIFSANETCTEVERLRRFGQRIVFTNGCFDILHAGHLACLEKAKRLGDVLIVGLNSDASVRRLKGDSRPRLSQDHRATLLAGLECVNVVVIFDEVTPELLLSRLRPDVLAKGGDYQVSQVVGADIVRAYGGDVVILPMVDGLSTSRILNESAIISAES